jgi:hypothetical protein
LLFCRVIEKREEHQRNVQIHTIPETVPTRIELIRKTIENSHERIDISLKLNVRSNNLILEAIKILIEIREQDAYNYWFKHTYEI